MLHKNLANSLKDVDAKSGVVCFYASGFNLVDDGNDMVMPGAYTKTIAEQGPVSKQPRIKHLYQHDTTQILGVPQVLKEDGFGLYVETKIVPTTLGKDALLLYSSGCLTEHSIGYETVVAEWDRAKGVRLLKQLRLFEVSSVTWGMLKDTPTVGIKSLMDPSRLSAMAEQAARLDALLHTGNLQSDALCETLERELKALHAALAPARSDARAQQPYSIQSVLASLDTVKQQLSGAGTASTKAASQDDKDAQQARSDKYGIGVKDGGHVTKPGQWEALDDSDFGDPVNYKLPLPDKAHADNAASRFAQDATRAQYTKDEQAIIDKRIAAAQKKFGESADDHAGSSGGKAQAVSMNPRLVKGTGGEVAVAADGTHAAYTGTHTHAHKAMGSQGSDATHEHAHTHDGNANHDHPADHKQAAATPSETSAHQQRPVRKAARDFDTLFASLNASDQLQDDWGDTFIAFTHAMEELMYQGYAQTAGYLPVGTPTVDIAEAAQANLDAFGKALMDLVTRSIAADFAPRLDDDGDQFLDPDGINAHEDGDDEDCYYGDYAARDMDGVARKQPSATARAPQRMPDAPARLRKEGREISSANRQTIVEALDGMSEAMKSLQSHHGTIADLMTKTDPDHVRADEYQALGDDDTRNGGGTPSDRNKQHAPPLRRTAATPPTSAAGTTLDDGPDDSTSVLVADLDSVISRLRSGAGKVR